jgi:uncharacterized SAM-binding protein YcdF (DUF218 family)
VPLCKKGLFSKLPFLFFSKLLPSLFYPLGFSCILILIALVLLGKKSHFPRFAQMAKVCLGAALLILWLSSTSLGAQVALGSLEQAFVNNGAIETLPTVNAIVVLGGATHGASGSRIYPEVNDAGDRLVHGVRLYRAGKANWILLSGGRIQWKQTSSTSQTASKALSEAEDMKSLLELFGIPDRAFILEPESLNTYQNAVNTKALLVEHDLKRILLVTSAFHMPRALAIFKKLGIDAIPAPTDFRVSREPGEESASFQQFCLDLLPSADQLKNTSMGMKEYMGLWVYRLRGWA